MHFFQGVLGANPERQSYSGGISGYRVSWYRALLGSGYDSLALKKDSGGFIWRDSSHCTFMKRVHLEISEGKAL